MTECVVVGCGRPAQAKLCPESLRELVSALRKVARHPRKDAKGASLPGLAEELFVTLTRQHVLGSATGSRGKAIETPLPFHQDASEAIWELDNTISTWAREVAEAHPEVTLTARTTAEAAEWLATLPNVLAMHPEAGEFHDEVTEIVRRVERVIDRAPDKVYLGRCEFETDGVVCEADLYGSKDEAEVQCRSCGASHDSVTRFLKLQERVRESLATASEIAEAAQHYYGRSLNVKTIRTWAQRGQIDTFSTNAKGEPMHKVGQVLDWADRRAALRRSA